MSCKVYIYTGSETVATVTFQRRLIRKPAVGAPVVRIQLQLESIFHLSLSCCLCGNVCIVFSCLCILYVVLRASSLLVLLS